MKKRKDFNQSQTASIVKQDLVTSRTPELKSGIPENKIISLGKNASNARNYYFTKHYGQGFDAITSAVQQTIEIMLSESIIEASTISCYCRN